MPTARFFAAGSAEQGPDDVPAAGNGRVPFGNGEVLGIAVALAPPLAVVAPLGLAPLSVVAALGVLVVRLRDGWRRPWRPLIPTVLFALLCLLGLVSALWSIVPGLSLARLPPLVGGIACGLVLLDAGLSLGARGRGLVGRLLACGIAVALAILLAERLAGFPIRHLAGGDLTDLTALQTPYNRGLSTLALLVWPAALVLWRRHPGWGVLLILFAFGTTLGFASGAARLAILLGAAAFAACRLWPRFGPVALSVLMVAYIAIAPSLHGRVMTVATLGLHVDSERLNSTIVPRSGYHRLLIWTFAAERVAEHPLSGWGLDASRAIPGRDVKLDSMEEALPLHPHNAALQLWLELGLGGALLGAVLVAWTLGRVRAAPWPAADRAAAAAAMVAAFTIANLSYGTWQSWWLAALFLAAACAVAVAAPTTTRPAA